MPKESLEAGSTGFKKKIKNVLKPNGQGSFAVFREVTGEEIDEIKAGKVVIQNRSLQNACFFNWFKPRSHQNITKRREFKGKMAPTVR